MAQIEKQPGKSDDGVSEILGELMLTAITVMIFAILIAAVSAMMVKPQTEIVHMNALAVNSSTVIVQHAGGDTVLYADVRIAVNGTTPALTPADSDGNGRWDLGEAIYIYNLDTSQSLSVIVYDDVRKQTIGNFNIG